MSDGSTPKWIRRGVVAVAISGLTGCLGFSRDTPPEETFSVTGLSEGGPVESINLEEDTPSRGGRLAFNIVVDQPDIGRQIPTVLLIDPEGEQCDHESFETGTRHGTVAVKPPKEGEYEVLAVRGGEFDGTLTNPEYSGGEIISRSQFTLEKQTVEQ